eukprot:8257539-Alexandrium_andersonii.AAC.1
MSSWGSKRQVPQGRLFACPARLRHEPQGPPGLAVRRPRRLDRTGGPPGPRGRSRHRGSCLPEGRARAGCRQR